MSRSAVKPAESNAHAVKSRDDNDQKVTSNIHSIKDVGSWLCQQVPIEFARIQQQSVVLLGLI